MIRYVEYTSLLLHVPFHLSFLFRVSFVGMKMKVAGFNDQDFGF